MDKLLYDQYAGAKESEPTGSFPSGVKLSLSNVVLISKFTSFFVFIFINTSKAKIPVRFSRLQSPVWWLVVIVRFSFLLSKQLRAGKRNFPFLA